MKKLLLFCFFATAPAFGEMQEELTEVDFVYINCRVSEYVKDSRYSGRPADIPLNVKLCSELSNAVKTQWLKSGLDPAVPILVTVGSDYYVKEITADEIKKYRSRAITQDRLDYLEYQESFITARKLFPILIEPNSDPAFDQIKQELKAKEELGQRVSANWFRRVLAPMKGAKSMLEIQIGGSHNGGLEATDTSSSFRIDVDLVDFTTKKIRFSNPQLLKSEAKPHDIEGYILAGEKLIQRALTQPFSPYEIDMPEV